MTDVPTVPFHDGQQIPQLGLGVWQVEDDVAADVVEQAIRAGYRHIDTAAIYGNEEGVGRAARQGLEGQRPGAGKQVEHARALDATQLLDTAPSRGRLLKTQLVHLAHHFQPQFVIQRQLGLVEQAIRPRPAADLLGRDDDLRGFDKAERAAVAAEAVERSTGAAPMTASVMRVLLTPRKAPARTTPMTSAVLESTSSAIIARSRPKSVRAPMIEGIVPKRRRPGNRGQAAGLDAGLTARPGGG